MDYLIGIDIGTSGTKTAIFQTNGHLVASDTAEYPLYQPHNGWAEQNPEDWWNAVVITCRNVLRNSGMDPRDIISVGLSGQMHGLVMLDGENRVLRPSIIWCDQRTSRECAEITSRAGFDRLVEITANPALTGFTASKILWVRSNEPLIYQKCRHILLPKDYIRFMLTGVYATEVSDASGMQLLDVPNRCWSSEILSKLEIDRELLPEVYESPEISGYVLKNASALTGLAEGTPVAGGAGDNAAAAVGAGVVEEGRAFCTIGTSGVVYAHSKNVHIDNKGPVKGRVHTFCCAVPGEWHIMGVTQAAGLSLKWFRDNFCETEKKEAENLGVDPYVLLDKAAGNVPVGSNKLVYLPYLMGERTPHLDPDCRGVFLGLSAIHTKYDMLRAVMEGVTFSQRDSLEILREMGIEIDEIIACGGGGSSSFWRQMIADVFNCRVSAAVSKDGAALGAAILAGTGCGIYSSVKDACREIIKLNPPREPDPENFKLYEKYYSVYRNAYPALKQSFKALAAIN